LAFATVGSGERPHTGGEWVATCTVLLDAGASRAGVWITGKPPSEEVAELIARYGITLDEPQADESTNGSESSGAPADAEPLAELAEQIESAYRTIDLELMASLLAPDVTWGGGSEGCSNREQVLQWYSRLANEQIDIADVDVHVCDGAIVADLTFTRPAIDARPAPPMTVSQTFRVADGLIVEIGG
jgi:SnoaL-like protein